MCSATLGAHPGPGAPGREDRQCLNVTTAGMGQARTGPAFLRAARRAKHSPSRETPMASVPAWPGGGEFKAIVLCSHT